MFYLYCTWNSSVFTMYFSKLSVIFVVDLAVTKNLKLSCRHQEFHNWTNVLMRAGKMLKITREPGVLAHRPLKMRKTLKENMKNTVLSNRRFILREFAEQVKITYAIQFLITLWVLDEWKHNLFPKWLKFEQKMRLENIYEHKLAEVAYET